MAWVKQTFAKRAEEHVLKALRAVSKEQEKVQTALESMSLDEWKDWIEDMEKLLQMKDKHNWSMIEDQWDEIQWNRLNIIRKALGLLEVGPSSTVHSVV